MTDSQGWIHGWYAGEGWKRAGQDAVQAQQPHHAVQHGEHHCQRGGGQAAHCAGPEAEQDGEMIRDTLMLPQGCAHNQLAVTCIRPHCSSRA